MITVCWELIKSVSHFVGERKKKNEINWNISKAGIRHILSINEVDFAFRYCPPGSFTMGSPSGEEGRFDNEDQKKIKINEGFWIGETPTTQKQRYAIKCRMNGKSSFEGIRHPVENVSWDDCVYFVKKLNELGVAPDGWRFDLPTEEQWEYACRAGTKDANYGKKLDDCAWYEANSDGSTHEVVSMKKKPNKWGIRDMLGNVWEWTNSKDENGNSMICRGGSWGCEARYCRPACRCNFDPKDFWSDLGFRIVLVLS